MIGASAFLVAGSVLVYLFRFELEEPRRWLVALATLGFFLAPTSEKPLRVGLWLVGIGITAWEAQTAGAGRGGFPLWLGCSIAGALLLVRGGSRAAAYYLPKAGNEEGRALSRSIRAQLQISVALFLVGYVFDRGPGLLFVALSAIFFLRYVLLQSKHLSIASVPLAFEKGIVPSQRWVLLAVFAILGGTSIPKVFPGVSRDSLLLTATLLLVTSAMIFVLSLTRTGWPRPMVRRAAFAAGVLLAVAVTAVLVELEGWDRTRYRVFASTCIAFLVVLPFLRERTKLFLDYPRLAALVPPVWFAILMAPVTAIGGGEPRSSTAVFLVVFSVLMLAYHALVAFRAKAKSAPYLLAALGLVLYLFYAGGGDRAWQVFLISIGFALYAVDRIERVWRDSRPRERIPAS